MTSGQNPFLLYLQQLSSEVDMLGGLGPMELIIILLIVILLFGGKKIPEIAKGLGKGIRDFKSSMSGADADAEDKNAKSENKEIPKS
jgi:sec-independent protein translocase protein TatA